MHAYCNSQVLRFAFLISRSNFLITTISQICLIIIQRVFMNVDTSFDRRKSHLQVRFRPKDANKMAELAYLVGHTIPSVVNVSTESALVITRRLECTFMWIFHAFRFSLMT